MVMGKKFPYVGEFTVDVRGVKPPPPGPASDELLSRFDRFGKRLPKGGPDTEALMRLLEQRRSEPDKSAERVALLSRKR